MTNANNNTTTLRIRHEANLTSYGTHHNGNCKPIIAVELHRTFNSLTDAADFFGVEPQYIWQVLNGKLNTIGLWERDENGNRIRLICRCRLTYASHFESAVDKLMDCGRKATEQLNKANERIESLKKYNEELNEELTEYRAWKAEQEAKRKAEEERIKAEAKAKEERELAIAKANKNVERKQRIFDRLMDALLEAEIRLNEAKMERDALLKGDDE